MKPSRVRNAYPHIIRKESLCQYFFQFSCEGGQAEMQSKKFAVFGHPIGHTMSPFIHSRLFRLSGTEARYGAADLAPEALSSGMERLRSLDGFNVTIPLKRAIIPFLDALDQKAALFGSVNTVKNESGRLTGFTTDGDGFRMALSAAGIKPDGRTVVLGAGGAARAVAFEAALAGGRVTVAARPHSAQAAAELCADLSKKVPGARADCCPIGEIEGEADLLVNATPAGMYPDLKSCPAGAELLRRVRFVFDAVYNPGETALLRLAEENGVPGIGGMAMLAWQAAAAQGIWTGARFRAEDVDRLCGEASLEMKKKFGNIVLCGFMGSGKTTAGRLLAESTGRRFVDLDQWIERKEGMTVSGLFARYGEARFRELERTAAEELSYETGLVIAAGGGALLDARCARALKAGGVVVLLDAGLPAVRARLAGDRTRPLLQRPDREEALRSLYAARLPVYRERAELTVPADGTPAGTAQAVMKAVAPAF